MRLFTPIFLSIGLALSISFPDSPASSMQYNVYPTDDAAPDVLLETESFLQTVSTSVVPTRDHNLLVSWRVDLANDEDVADIRSHTGVKGVERPNAPPPGHSSETKRDDAPVKKWIAFVKDPKNLEEVNSTRTWLAENIKDQKTKVVELKDRDKNVEMFTRLTFDDDKLEEAKKQPGIKVLEQDFPMEAHRAVAETAKSWFSTVRENSKFAKRGDLSWMKQMEAPKDLTIDSQYDKQKLTNNFVFEQRAGGGVFIYVIDRGVEVHVKTKGSEEFHYVDPAEFPNFQSSASRDASEDADRDSDLRDTGHGTPVASKALGITHGIAKKATLIPVKVLPESGCLIEALDLILQDLEDEDDGHPERAAKSVVLMSMGIDESWPDPDTAKQSETGTKLTTRLKSITDLGVPIVFSSGNKAKEGRLKIDTFPQILEDPNLPIINVGGADDNGNANDFSQGGDQLTISAPGTAKVHYKTDDQDGDAPGTSIAAPAVAGIIATYLNYDPPPWGQVDVKQRVAKIKEFIKDPKSSWKRGDVNMIWNGADSKAHDSAKPVPWGKCTFYQSPNVAPTSAHYTIVGAGWLSENNGGEEPLRKSLVDKQLVSDDPDAVQFEYKSGDDGREWDMRFQTTTDTETKVQDSIREVANYPGFGPKCEITV
ncbi:peptidase S8/S53 domain-containing protein [Lophiotrema nucula]|uniref:Peptidase S8/S53 domain-containing protein n=1 Tax=Lophiotrema nucula TaxID=690887 RepID=A0A6A5YFF9_9PLEO|nr:peptidase S8/S53 domain-containing protein [Lophiotrema nucula]